MAIRSFGTKPPPGNPLDMIRKECAARKLCDEHGLRRPGVHWVFSLAVTPDDVNEVGITQYCRGVKRNSHATTRLLSQQSIFILIDISLLF